MTSSHQAERQSVTAIAAVTLAALGLRLFRLDAQSAWIDEAFTIHAAVQDWDEMMRILVRDFSHPPLHTMLVRWWFDLFGVGVLQARLLSAICGTLAVPALYWLGTLLFDRRTALLASILLAVSQLGIVYSQEARAYALLMCLVTLATACFVRAFQRASARDFALFVLLASLLSYTHHYGAFPIMAMAAFAWVYRRHSAIPATWWAAASVVAVVAYLPWLTSGVIQSAMQNPRMAVVRDAAAHLATPVHALNSFNNGKIAGVRDPTPVWAFVLGLVVFTGPAVMALRGLVGGTDRERRSLALVLLAAAVPVVGVWSLGLLRVVYDVRHVSFVVAPYYLLVALGATRIAPPWAHRAAVVALIGFSVLSFRADYFVPYKENYRDALNVVATQARAGDCTIAAAPNRRSSARLYWDSYHHPQEPPELVSFEVVSSRSDCQRAWVVWDRTAWKGGTLTYADLQATMAPAFQPGERWRFLGVDVQLFVRRKG